jgi:hypothetical protein
MSGKASSVQRKRAKGEERKAKKTFIQKLFSRWPFFAPLR